MSAKSSQKAMIAQFCSITGANEKTASKTLKISNWKLNNACDSYFTSHGPSASYKIDDILSELFENYRLPTDDDDLATVDGMMKYLKDIGVDLENVEMFVALEIIQAPALGEMSKEGFVEGWKNIVADTIPKQRTYVRGQINLLSSNMTLFKRVYKHVFVCAKEKGQKAMPLEHAIVYWQLLFSPPGMKWATPRTDWLKLWIDFISTKWSKSVNKDMWNQTAFFFEKTIEDETLGFWSEDGAWPGVIDQFVGYAKKERGDVSDTMETD